MKTKGISEYEHNFYNCRNVYLTEDIVVYHKDVDKDLLENVRTQYERRQ